MELQEYHVKRIFKQAGLPVLKGAVAYSPEEADCLVSKLGRGPYFLRAQVMDMHRSYGRVLEADTCVDGYACVTDKKQVAAVAAKLFAKPDWIAGMHPLFEVQKIYIEAGFDQADILCRLILRVNFEKQCEMFTLENNRGQSKSFVLTDGLNAVVMDKALAFVCGKNEMYAKTFLSILKKTYRLFKYYGAVAVELSPIVVLKDGSLKVLDGRLVFDPNTVGKFPELASLIESRVGKEREKLARQNHFRYMGLKGNIACVVNGIGLGWATLDLIQRKGGRAAALLDVGTKPTKETVTKALKLVLSEPNVDGVLINIFGGTTRCDLLAEGLIAASPEMAVGLPIVVRIDGMNAEIGQRVLFESRLPFIIKTKTDDAVRAIIQAVKGR